MLQNRDEINYVIMKVHRLMQQYVIISYARDQAQKLKYHRQKLNNKRQAKYRDLGRNLNNDNSSG